MRPSLFRPLVAFSFPSSLSVDWTIDCEGAQKDRRVQRNHKVGKPQKAVECILISATSREDDTNWPKKNIVGKQELEIRIGNDHIAFEVRIYDVPRYGAVDH